MPPTKHLQLGLPITHKLGFPYTLRPIPYLLSKLTNCGSLQEKTILRVLGTLQKD